MLMNGQVWISESDPHQDFEIYDNLPDEQIYFWKRYNEKAFDEHVRNKKGYYPSELYAMHKNTFPFAWAGECSKKSLKEKIKKYNMKLK